MGSSRWQRAGAWVAAGGITAGAVTGCQPATPASTDPPVRSDVTDIRPMTRATADAAEGDPPLYDTSGLIPMAPQPVTEPTATLAAASVTPAPVVPTVTPPPPTASPGRVAAAAKAHGRTHVVRRGETLFAIARAQYGNGAEWRRLAAANPTAAAGPLRVGQRLVLP